jgi:hypothetical protein
VTSFPKRLTITVASILAVAGLGAGAYGFSSAEFTAATAPTTNTFSAGTVSFDNGAPVTSFSLTNRAPGDSASSKLTLHYDGTLNAWVRLNTLIVPSVPGPWTGGAPAPVFPFIVSAESPASHVGPPADYYNDQAINRYPMNTAGVPVEVACPSTFGGQPLNAPVGSFCFLAQVLVLNTGVNAAAANTLPDEGGQTEIGAWPGTVANAGGWSRTIDVFAALGGPATGLNAGGAQRGFGPIDINVPNTATTDRLPAPGTVSYQNASFKILLFADAVAARNNINATHDGPLTWS